MVDGVRETFTEVREVLVTDMERNQWGAYSSHLRKKKNDVIFISKDATVISASYILVRIEFSPELEKEKKRKANSENINFYFNIDEVMLLFF